MTHDPFRPPIPAINDCLDPLIALLVPRHVAPDADEPSGALLEFNPQPLVDNLTFTMGDYKRPACSVE